MNVSYSAQYLKDTLNIHKYENYNPHHFTIKINTLAQLAKSGTSLQ